MKDFLNWALEQFMEGVTGAVWCLMRLGGYACVVAALLLMAWLIVQLDLPRWLPSC